MARVYFCRMNQIKPFDFAYSLGHACRAAFQLRRVFGELSCPTGVFDWQKTPRRARRRYFKQNFDGMFERSDLMIGPDGVVTHRRYATWHIHEFPGGTTSGTLDEAYVTARGRHDYLTARMREHFNSDLRLLLAVSHRHNPLQFLQLQVDLRLAFPRLRFWLVNAPVDDNADWMGTDDLWTMAFSDYRPTGLVVAGRERATPNLHEESQAGMR